MQLNAAHKAQRLSVSRHFLLGLRDSKYLVWMRSQTSATNPSARLRLRIRGEPTLLTCSVCVVSLPAFRSACVSGTLCCVCELSGGCFSTPWKPELCRSECCLYSSISSSSLLAKSPAWVCVLLQGCVAKLSSHFIYTDPLYVRSRGGVC